MAERTTRDFERIDAAEAWLAVHWLNAAGVYGETPKDPTYIECIGLIHDAVLNYRNEIIFQRWDSRDEALQP